MKLMPLIIAGILLFFSAQSFIQNNSSHKNLHTGLLPTLSDYPIYIGTTVDLFPQKDFIKYELANFLFFSDYAEKERLIKLPPGSKLKATNDGLPDFPDGTMLVKTFFTGTIKEIRQQEK